jgi:hypothetical protein
MAAKMTRRSACSAGSLLEGDVENRLFCTVRFTLYDLEFSGSAAYNISARRKACSIGNLTWFRQRINSFDRKDILSDAEGNVAQAATERQAASEGGGRRVAAGVR